MLRCAAGLLWADLDTSGVWTVATRRNVRGCCVHSRYLLNQAATSRTSSAERSHVWGMPLAAISLAGTPNSCRCAARTWDCWIGTIGSESHLHLFLQTSSPLPMGTTRASTRSSERARWSSGRSVSSWFMALSATRMPPATMRGTTAS